MASPFFSTTTSPLIIGHRGASGHALENSLRAFRLAAARAGSASCDGVELDLQTTLDGQFVVHHDPVLSSGAPIAAIELSTVRATPLADGSPIPTLGEALETLAGLTVFVEAKTLPFTADQSLIALLHRHGLERTAVHAFDHRIIARLHRAVPELPLGVLSASYPVNPMQQLIDAGATMLWQEATLIDAALVAGCHRQGVTLIAWTVNDGAEARRLAALGVDGLCGNWPERLRLAQ